MSERDLQLEAIKKNFLNKVDDYLTLIFTSMTTGDIQMGFDASRAFNKESFLVMDELISHAKSKEVMTYENQTLTTKE